MGDPTRVSPTQGMSHALEREQTPRVGNRVSSDDRRVHIPRLRDTCRRESDPRRLIAPSTMWDWRQIWRVGFYQNAVVGDATNHIVAVPVPERDNSAERYVPTGFERDTRQLDGTGETVKHATHPFCSGFADHVRGIFVGVAGVHHNRARESPGELELHRERATLQVARRVVVVVVESAFSDRNRAGVEQALQSGNICTRIERCRVVRMDSGRKSDEARMRCRNPGRSVRLLDRCTDTDDARSARVAGADDYRVAVAGERFVGEVGVAVEEAFHAGELALRGYLRSIHRSTGPAM